MEMWFKTAKSDCLLLLANGTRSLCALRLKAGRLEVGFEECVGYEERVQYTLVRLISDVSVQKSRCMTVYPVLRRRRTTSNWNAKQEAIVCVIVGSCWITQGSEMREIGAG